MRRISYLTLAAALCASYAAKSAGAQELYTTQNDFSQWPTFTAQATPDSDGGTVNGVGNTSAAGAAGTAGSLLVTESSGTYNYNYGPGEQGNAALLSALGASGTILIDYTTPTNNGGSYFQLGLVLNYSGNFGQFFGGTPVNDGNGFSTVAIPYTINVQPSYSYFEPGVIFNSNYDTSGPTSFTIDNIRLAPEPASVCGLGGLGFLAMRRRR